MGIKLRETSQAFRFGTSTIRIWDLPDFIYTIVHTPFPPPQVLWVVPSGHQNPFHLGIPLWPSGTVTRLDRPDRPDRQTDAFAGRSALTAPGVAAACGRGLTDGGLPPFSAAKPGVGPLFTPKHFKNNSAIRLDVVPVVSRCGCFRAVSSRSAIHLHTLHSKLPQTVSRKPRPLDPYFLA